MKNNVNEIITNALISNKINNISNEQELIIQLKQIINENIYILKTTNQIDIKNDNGFELDFNTTNKILNRYINIESLINKDNETKIMDNNMLYSNVYTPLGVILVLFNGDTYTMLELIILALLTHNTMIFAYDKYMCGTNGFLITLIQSILEQNNYNKNMFQHTFDIKNEDYFKHFKSIDKTLLIGNNDFITKYLKLCTTDVLVSGYKNYDIYIEDDTHIEFIKKIISENKEINIYINSALKLEFNNAIYVNDIDEAITQINYNGSKYSASIFTNDNEKATNFIKNIKSKFVMVNTSPTLEQALDINQENLLKEKTIMLPNIFNKKTSQ